MKRLLRITLLLSFLFLAGMAKSMAQTVYVSETGKKYHAKNCSLAKTGKSGMQLSEAKKKGYEPCKSCKADAIKPEEKKGTGTKGKK
jgi:NOL1/NOP2/fmu family ribosome biogenesis protein